MTEQVAAQTRELRRIGAELARLAECIDGVRSRAESASQQQWGVWGGDEYGTNFVSGTAGYESSDANIRSVLMARAQLLQQYSRDLQNAADQLDAMDSGNAGGFGRR